MSWSTICFEIPELSSWKALIAEFIGTLLLVLIGCGSCIGWNDADLVQISLAFGIIVATVVQCISHISGGHINPAVTIAFLITGKIGILRCLLYIFFQCSGASLGAGLLREFTPVSLQKSLGATLVNDKIGLAAGFGVEFLITFVLVFTVFAVCDTNRGDVNGSAPLAIGLAVTACHLFAIPYTGAGMNPARSFGPAAAMGIWTNHWIYWFGPVLGGLSGSVLYKFVLGAPKPVVSRILEDDLSPVALVLRPSSLTPSP